MAACRHFPNLSMTGCGASLECPQGSSRKTGIAGSGRKPTLVVPFERTGEPGQGRLAGMSLG
ncbi:hypothetical protein SXCC_03732 [Gluconacetobacter sp. SXCC-1]|nr:hypothetical protein CT154_02670 [Komagataeibacter xylinus]EGG75615.1 hypothetical protein SXCC_03732 [Gluconacetobacter sp. SXCC-1]